MKWLLQDNIGATFDKILPKLSNNLVYTLTILASIKNFLAMC